jgi:hypothetical protein
MYPEVAIDTGFAFACGRCVPRPPSPAIAARNHELYSLWRDGVSLADLAEQFQITRQRVGQVIAAYHPADDEEIDRSLYRGYLWRLFEEIRDLYRNPGFKMAPTGKPATGPDDEPAEDTNVKLQAGELELKILESLRKLDARDRAQKRDLHVQVDVATQQMQAAIAAERARLEQLAKQAQAVQGEVVREIEPPGQDHQV